MKIRIIHAKKKTELGVVTLDKTATVEDLNREIAKISMCALTAAKIAPLRQRITYEELEPLIAEMSSSLAKLLPSTVPRTSSR
jgi:hypothetical protein